MVPLGDEATSDSSNNSATSKRGERHQTQQCAGGVSSQESCHCSGRAAVHVGDARAVATSGHLAQSRTIEGEDHSQLPVSTVQSLHRATPDLWQGLQSRQQRGHFFRNVSLSCPLQAARPIDQTQVYRTWSRLSEKNHAHSKRYKKRTNSIASRASITNLANLLLRVMDIFVRTSAQIRSYSRTRSRFCSRSGQVGDQGPRRE